MKKADHKRSKSFLHIILPNTATITSSVVFFAWLTGLYLTIIVLPSISACGRIVEVDPLPAHPTYARLPTPVPPRLLQPSTGETIATDSVTFEWEGRLTTNQTFRVILRHTDSGQEFTSPNLAVNTWETELPLDMPGEYRWQVHIIQDNVLVASSTKSHLWFGLFPLEPTLTFSPSELVVEVAGCTVIFKWNWGWALPENEWFAVRVGKDQLHSITWTKETAFVHSFSEPGNYNWEIAVCQSDDPAEHECKELAVSEQKTFYVGECQPTRP